MSADPAIGAVLLALEKEFGKEAAGLLGYGAHSAVSEVIPTGLTVLDRYVLGIGGLPCGRMSEVYSEEGTGKTSLMLHCLAACQRAGGFSILAETENALDPDWAAEVHGIDPDALVLLEPDSLEDTTQRIAQAITAVPPNAGPVLVAWDSIASTPTKLEIEDGVVGSDAVAARARHLSRACRVLAKLLKDSRVHLMFINQVRDRIGVMFGSKQTTPGGHAVKFHSSVRFKLFGGKKVEGAFGEHKGKDITVVGVKNKLHPPWRKARLRLDFATGFDEQWSTLSHAKDRKLAKPRSRGKVAYREALTKLGWAPEKKLPRPCGERRGRYAR